MKEYFDHRLKKTIIGIDLGDVAVSGNPVFISTILGSCVAVVLYDPDHRIGGMNHFQIPEPYSTSDTDQRRCFYGSYAIPRLFQFMEAAGSRRGRIRAKLFGGACSHFCEDESLNLGVGQRNIAYAEEFLDNEGIPVERQDVGGDSGRRIYLDVNTFAVYVRRLSEQESVS